MDRLATLILISTVALSSLWLGARAETVYDLAANQAAVPVSKQASIDGGMADALARVLRDAEQVPHSGVGAHLNSYRIVATRTGRSVLISLFPGIKPGYKGHLCAGNLLCFSATYTLDQSGQRILNRHLWEN